MENMQYILSKDELDNLVSKEEKTKRDKALDIARKRILKVSKFKCIHEAGHRGVCDNCPCLNTDEERKEYEFKVGSGHDLYALHKLICNLPRQFSK